MFEIVMDVFVIEDIVIYVRLVLICKEMVLFEWRVEYVEFVIEGQYFKYIFKNIINRVDLIINVLFILKYIFEDFGLYKIICIVRILSIWMDEYIFVKIFCVFLRVFIMGGE